MCHCWRGHGKEASPGLKMDESDSHCRPTLDRGEPLLLEVLLPAGCQDPASCSLPAAPSGLGPRLASRPLSKGVPQAPFLSHTLSLGHLIQPQSFKYRLYTSV